jgi:hypothetical protein
MPDRFESKAIAWQPLTFKGVASFAHASLNRLLLLQLAVAIAIASLTVWFVTAGWAPTLEQGIERLRPGAAIEQGRLKWPEQSAERLSEGPFIEFTVSPGGDGSIGQTADLQVDLTATELKLRSLFGYLAAPYPNGGDIGLSPEEAAASWGAWKGPALALIFLGTLVSLPLTWLALGVLYSVPALLFGFYIHRHTLFVERFKLCMAALLPAALFFAAAMILYTMRHLSLVGLLVAWILHILLGWTYVTVAMLQLPARKTTAGNPFATSRPARGRI